MNKEQKLTNKLYTDYVKQEWKRLVKDELRRLELDTTMHFLKKHLPKKGLILDAGGGPGRYTIELAKKGYNIVLQDLVQANLEEAKKQIKKAKVENKIKEIIQGSITKLPFKSNTFDAVLCLGGPLSHVHPEKARKKAISELIRVAKKKAPIFVSVMGKYGTIMNFFRWPHEITMTKHWRSFYNKGDDYEWHGGKAFCHYFTLNELKQLFKKTKIIEAVGLEGSATPSQEKINKHFKNKKFKKNWLEMHYKLCTEPTVADTSLHTLIIVKK